MTTAEARWNRLADSTSAATGWPVTVRESRYPGGIARSIGLKSPAGRVEVHDRFTKNYVTWAGYRVFLMDREGYTLRVWPVTKNRSKVAAVFASCVGEAASTPGGSRVATQTELAELLTSLNSSALDMHLDSVAAIASQIEVITGAAVPRQVTD